MTTTATAIWTEHLDTERRRRWADISQTDRDLCLAHDHELLEQLCDLEDAGDAEASDYLDHWNDEVPA